MKNIYKKVVVVFSLICFLLSTFIPLAQAEDIYYLKTELAETIRKQDVIADALIKMELFIMNYPERVKALENVVEELEKLKDKLKIVQRNNLIKSMLSLGLDTVSYVSLVSGLYLKSVKVIVLGIASELVQGKIGSSYSSGAYSIALQGVSYEAREALPEIEKLHMLLTLTQGEWRALIQNEVKNEKLNAKQKANPKIKVKNEVSEDLEEVRIVYAQITTLITEIDKNIDRAKAILKELHEAKDQVVGLRPKYQETWDELHEKRISLRTRLEDALANERIESIDSQMKDALSAVKKLPPLKAPMMLTGNHNADYEAWKKEYDRVKQIIDAEMPSTWAKVKKGREEIPKELKELADKYKEKVYISLQANRVSGLKVPWGDKAANPGLSYTMAQAALGYATALNGIKMISERINFADPAVDDLETVKQKAIDLSIAEEKFTQLLGLAHRIDADFRNIQGHNAVSQDRDINRVLWAMIPNFVNINKDGLGRGYVGTIVRAQSDIENSLTRAQESSKDYEYNKQLYKKIHTQLQKEYSEKETNIREIIANLENAHTKMFNELGDYNKEVKASGYSEKNGKLEVFDNEKFEQDLLSAMHKGDYGKASNMVAKYETLMRSVDQVYKPYYIAKEHYNYYFDHLSAEDASFINDLINAKNVSGNPFSVQVPSGISNGDIKSLLSQMSASCEDIRDLPVIGGEENSLEAQAYKLFLIYKQVQMEGKGWIALKSKAFFSKWEKAVDGVNEFVKDKTTSNAAGTVMGELMRIREAWTAAHKDDEDEPDDGIDVPSSGKYFLTDQRINGRSLPKAYGILGLTRDDLIGRSVEVSGRLNDLTRVKKLLISVDGGMTWNEVAVSQKVVYEFSPQLNKLYRVYLRIVLDSGIRHSEILIPTVESMLKDINWTIQDVDLIAVGLGPGSFTGLRIGVATVKAIQAACSSKIIGVPTMDAIAINAPKDKKRVAPFLDAHKGKIYTCIYERSGETFKRITEYLLVQADEFLESLEEETFFFGGGIEKYKKELDSCDFAEYMENIKWEPKADDIGRLAFGRVSEGYHDASELEPLYLHPRDCAITKKKE